MDITNYRKFLIDEISNIDEVCAEMNASYREKYLYPFADIKNTSKSLKWWKAYTDLKHTDVDARDQGCLSNILYGLAALEILTALFDEYFHTRRHIYQIGVYSNYFVKKEDILRDFTFPI
ncbi:MAG: hypothetical protein ABSA11_15560 [Candidatus Bathyarchaeia archaeon]